MAFILYERCDEQASGRTDRYLTLQPICPVLRFGPYVRLDTSYLLTTIIHFTCKHSEFLRAVVFHLRVARTFQRGRRLAASNMQNCIYIGHIDRIVYIYIYIYIYIFFFFNIMVFLLQIMIMPCGFGIALFYEREYVLFHKCKILLYTDLIDGSLIVSVAFAYQREREVQKPCFVKLYTHVR